MFKNLINEYVQISSFMDHKRINDHAQCFQLFQVFKWWKLRTISIQISDSPADIQCESLVYGEYMKNLLQIRNYRNTTIQNMWITYSSCSSFRREILDGIGPAKPLPRISLPTEQLRWLRTKLERMQYSIFKQTNLQGSEFCPTLKVSRQPPTEVVTA